MPKQTKSRKRDANFVVLKVDKELALATLADGAALSSALLDLNDDLTIIGTDLTWVIETLTPGEGPIDVGVNIGGYSAAQIVEAVDASPSSRADVIALEHTKRRVRHVGTFAGQLANEVLNNGNKVRTRKLFYKLANDVDLNMWAINRSGGALTTGAIVHASGKVYARWT